MDELEQEVKHMYLPKHSTYHNNKVGCRECLREDEYNKAIDDVLNVIKKHKTAIKENGGKG